MEAETEKFYRVGSSDGDAVGGRGGFGPPFGKL